MAAVAYTMRRADQALYESEAARERRHFERVPAREAEEVRAMYRAKGFEGGVARSDRRHDHGEQGMYLQLI